MRTSSSNCSPMRSTPGEPQLQAQERPGGGAAADASQVALTCATRRLARASPAVARRRLPPPRDPPRRSRRMRGRQRWRPRWDGGGGGGAAGAETVAANESATGGGDGGGSGGDRRVARCSPRFGDARSARLGGSLGGERRTAPSLARARAAAAGDSSPRRRFRLVVPPTVLCDPAATHRVARRPARHARTNDRATRLAPPRPPPALRRDARRPLLGSRRAAASVRPQRLRGSLWRAGGERLRGRLSAPRAPPRWRRMRLHSRLRSASSRATRAHRPEETPSRRRCASAFPFGGGPRGLPATGRRPPPLRVLMTGVRLASSRSSREFPFVAYAADARAAATAPIECRAAASCRQRDASSRRSMGSSSSSSSSSSRFRDGELLRSLLTRDQPLAETRDGAETRRAPRRSAASTDIEAAPRQSARFAPRHRQSARVPALQVRGRPQMEAEEASPGSSRRVAARSLRRVCARAYGDADRAPSTSVSRLRGRRDARRRQRRRRRRRWVAARGDAVVHDDAPPCVPMPPEALAHGATDADVSGVFANCCVMADSRDSGAAAARAAVPRRSSRRTGATRRAARKGDGELALVAGERRVEGERGDGKKAAGRDARRERTRVKHIVLNLARALSLSVVIFAVHFVVIISDLCRLTAHAHTGQIYFLKFATRYRRRRVSPRSRAFFRPSFQSKSLRFSRKVVSRARTRERYDRPGRRSRDVATRQTASPPKSTSGSRTETSRTPTCASARSAPPRTRAARQHRRGGQFAEVLRGRRRPRALPTRPRARARNRDRRPERPATETRRRPGNAHREGGGENGGEARR